MLADPASGHGPALAIGHGGMVFREPEKVVDSSTAQDVDSPASAST